MAEDEMHLRLLVSGRVQGVFFRASAAREAQSLGLRGWARNLADGRVEIVAEGRRRNLAMLLAWAHQGPPAARVDEVAEQWSQAQGLGADFTVR